MDSTFSDLNYSGVDPGRTSIGSGGGGTSLAVPVPGTLKFGAGTSISFGSNGFYLFRSELFGRRPGKDVDRFRGRRHESCGSGSRDAQVWSRHLDFLRVQWLLPFPI